MEILDVAFDPKMTFGNFLAEGDLVVMHVDFRCRGFIIVMSIANDERLVRRCSWKGDENERLSDLRITNDT